MHVGIIGSGSLAQSLTYRLRHAGHDVQTMDVTDPEVAAPSAVASDQISLEELARRSDVVILAVPLRLCFELPTKPFVGRVLVDTSDCYGRRSGAYPGIDAGTATSGMVLAERFAGAAVAQIFNAVDLITFAEMGPAGGIDDSSSRAPAPIASDEPGARAAVASLVSDLGLEPVDIGPLANGLRLLAGEPLRGIHIRPDDVRLRIADV